MEQVINLVLLGNTFATLFIIMDPPGVVPIFLALTGTYTHESRRKAAFQATIASFSILMVFMIAGRYILKFLQISLPALQLSGGIILFMMAMTMLQGKEGELADPGKNNIALVPLGTPLIAGPGAIVTIMVAIESSQYQLSDWVSVILALVLVHVTLWLSLRFGTYISKFLGESGTMLVVRIAGLLISAIAIELTAKAIFSYIDMLG